VKRNLYVLLSLLALTSLVLASCGAPATPAAQEPPAEPPATEAPATEAPATEAPTEVMTDFEGMSVAAPNCDYGGKISSIEAVDQHTVVFTMCKPDPAFLAKVAFVPLPSTRRNGSKPTPMKRTRRPCSPHPLARDRTWWRAGTAAMVST
jgi:hypothetical protein